VTFARPGFTPPYLAAAADGTVHMLFQEGGATSIEYSSCRSNCSTLSSWPVATLATSHSLGTTTTSPAGLAIDGTGRLHALLTGVSVWSSLNQVVYATCAANCSNASNWVLLDLSSMTGGQTLVMTVDTLMVDDDGAVSFLTEGTPGYLNTYFLSCASNCTHAANWTSAAVLDGNPIIARKDRAGVTHVAVRIGATSQGDRLLGYARCEGGCTTQGNWQVSSLGYMNTAYDSEIGFAVTDSGRAMLAFNQATTVGATANNQKLFINSCAGTTCSDLNAWSSFSVGELEEGSSGGLWLQAKGERVTLLSTTVSDLRLRSCGASCENSTSWSGATIVDTSSAVSAVFAPDTGSQCPGTSSSSWWYPSNPRMTTSSTGTVVVHEPYSIVQCPGVSGSQHMPSVGRLLWSP
jgi:hypothetical protein